MAGMVAASEDSDAADRGTSASPLSSVSPAFETATYYAYVGASVSMTGSVVYEEDYGYDARWVVSVTSGYGLTRSAYTDPLETSSTWGKEDVGKVSGTISKAGTVQIAWRTETYDEGAGSPDTASGTVTIVAIAKTVDVTRVEIEPVKSSISIGESTRIDVDVSPGNATDRTVTWSIASGSTYVTISGDDSSCTVTGRAYGTATIRCDANDGSGRYDTCTITVEQAVVKVTSVTISGPTGVSTGSSVRLSASVLPTGSTDRTVTWSVVSGGSAVSISPSGTSCTVHGVSPGTATIRCTANDGSGKYDTHAVVVSRAAASPITITAGGTASVTWSGIGVSYQNAAETWFDRSLVSVYAPTDSPGYSGYLECLEVGSVTSGGFTVSCPADVRAGTYTVSFRWSESEGDAEAGIYETQSVEVTVVNAADGTSPSKALKAFDHMVSVPQNEGSFTRTLYVEPGARIQWTAGGLGPNAVATAEGVSHSTGSGSVTFTGTADTGCTMRIVYGVYTFEYDIILSEYTVRYDPCGGSGSMPDQTMSYGSSQTLRANAFSKTDHVFKGWSVSSGGPVAYSDGQSVRDLSTGAPVTLYAVWERPVWKVSISAGTGGSVSVAEVLADNGTAYGTDGNVLTIGGTEIEATPDAGYVFGSWSSASGKITADRTMTATFTKVTGFSVSPSTIGTAVSPFVEGSGKRLTATANPSGVRDSIEWTTSDDSVVRIDGTATGTSITIIAVSEGTAIVTAKVAGLEKSCSVTVSALTIAFDDGTDRVVQTTDRTTIAWTTNGASSNMSVTDLDGAPVPPDVYSASGTGKSRAIVFSQAGSYLVKVTATNGTATAEDVIRFEVASKMYTFSIEFYDGGTLLDTVTLPQTAESSVSYTVDFTPKAGENAEFLGWTRTVGSTDRIVPGSEVTLSSDDNPLVLHASWRFSYSLTYVDAYAMNVPEGIDGTTEKRENVTVPISSVIPSYGDFIFMGWSASLGGIAEYGSGEGLRTEIELPYDRDTRLYSVWADAHTCSVTYISESEAVGIPDVQTFTSASTDRHVFEIPKGPISQYGYVFKGWALSETGRAIYGNPSEFEIGGDVEYGTIELGCDENIRLYAVWEVRVTYDGNGGTPERGSDDVRYGNVAILPGAQRTADRVPIDGGVKDTAYVLLGWSVDRNRLTPDEGMEPGCEYTVRGTVTLYAVWRADASESEWIVSFDPAGGVCETVTLMGAIEGLPSASWETVSEPIEGGHRDTVHTFLGWSSDRGAAEPDSAAGDPFLPTGDTTLYAVWETVSEDVLYRVAFDPEGGECDVSVTEGMVASLPSAARAQERTGIPGGYRITSFEFLGWSASDDATEPDSGCVAGDRFVPVGDVTLHAVWGASSEDTLYTLTYDPCNGDGTITDRFDAASDVRTIRDLGITKDGYVLLGWSASKDSDTADFATGGAIVLTDDTVIYAVWAERDAAVHISKLLYDARGGSMSISEQVSMGIDAGDRVFDITSLIPVKVHWRFAGWTATEDSDIAELRFGDTVTVSCDGERTLYAVWEPIMCSVTFDSAEGSPVDGTTVQEGGSIVLPTATREGYDLEGWYLGDVRFGGAGEKATVDSDLVLVAHWAVHTGSSDDDGSDALIAASFGAVAVLLLLIAVVSRMPFVGLGAAVCGAIAVLLGVLR